jgi:hypothetical protein
MILLKACPRCRGDLYPEEDHYGSYYNCLQCGLEIFPQGLQLASDKVSARRVKQAIEVPEAA